MPYQVFMHQVAVLERELEGTEQVVRRVLEERLGRPLGVIEAHLAALQLLTPHLPGAHFGVHVHQVRQRERVP